jgi:hypothetical protein
MQQKHHHAMPMVDDVVGPNAFDPTLFFNETAIDEFYEQHQHQHQQQHTHNQYVLSTSWMPPTPPSLLMQQQSRAIFSLDRTQVSPLYTTTPTPPPPQQQQQQQDEQLLLKELTVDDFLADNTTTTTSQPVPQPQQFRHHSFDFTFTFHEHQPQQQQQEQQQQEEEHTSTNRNSFSSSRHNVEHKTLQRSSSCPPGIMKRTQKLTHRAATTMNTSDKMKLSCNKRKRAPVPKGQVEFVQTNEYEIKRMIQKYHKKMDAKEQLQGLVPYESFVPQEAPKSLEVQKKKTRNATPYDSLVMTFQLK